jgi:hypothetical protein
MDDFYTDLKAYDYMNDDPRNTPYNRWMNAAVNEFQIALSPLQGWEDSDLRISRLHLFRALYNVTKMVEEVIKAHAT